MWFLYILRCEGGALYTGVTRDIPRRIREHAGGRGSKYLRSRTPLKLVHSESFRRKSSAFKREALIKSWSRAKKLELIRAAAAKASLGKIVAV